MLTLLNGIRILDLSRLFTLTSSRLADLGADVIKIEEPSGGDYMRAQQPLIEELGVSMTYMMLNRNKRSVALDLKSEKGREVFFRLLDTADAIIEFSKPGASARIGLDFVSVRKVKPDIVYCSLSGFGQDGPYRNLAAHGLNIDALAGTFKIEYGPTGRPEIRSGSAMGIYSGSIHAALGIVAGLVQRYRNGAGQYIDVSCWDAAVDANSEFYSALNLGIDGDYYDRTGEGGFGPRYNVYGTRDDKVILLCPLERKFWVSFCEVIDRPEWLDRGEWSEPLDFGLKDPSLRDDIETVIRTRDCEDWMSAFLAAGVPSSPVTSLSELMNDPHLDARRIVLDAKDAESQTTLKFVRPPFRVPEGEFEIERSAPRLGQNTTDILRELGYDDSLIAALAEAGTIGLDVTD